MLHAMLGFSVVPAGVSPVQFLALGMVSIVIVGAAKAGFAGGFGLLSTPLMIYACQGASIGDVRLAQGIMLVPLIVCDYVSVVYWRGKWDWRNVRLLLPGMAAGIGVGWVLMWQFERLGLTARGMDTTNALLKLMIGLLAVGFVALRIVRALRPGGGAFRPKVWHGLLTGTSIGAASTLTHGAGPISTMFLFSQRMERGRFVATATLLYWFGNQLKLVPYYFLGRLNQSAMVAAAAMLPAVILGAVAGILLHRRVNEKVFALAVYVLLGLTGAHLVFASIAQLCAG